MNAFLTAAAFVVLIAGAAYVIHRLNNQHADRIAVHRYSAPLPGRRGRGTPQPPVGPDRSESPPRANGVTTATGAAAGSHRGAAAAVRRRSYDCARSGPGPMNRGVMTLPQLNIYRHDRGRRALITLAGEIDPVTAPQVRTALERCLSDASPPSTWI
ncbi:hypothetical protein GCM10011428_34670 [Streptomyces violaceus]